MTNRFSNYSLEQLEELAKEIKNNISALDGKQQAIKIGINSAYGAIANVYFRLYDPVIAGAITMTGQTAVKFVGRRVNEFLNKLFKTNNVDYVIAQDTDSGYFNLSYLVETAINKGHLNNNTSEIVDYLNNFCKGVLQKIINDACLELKERMNLFDHKLFMKRESIGPMIAVRKKGYVMKVYDKENVRYEKPKTKIMGLDAVRSSTPEFCREKIKTCYEMFFNNTEKDVIEYIENVKKEFMKLHYRDIALSSSANNVLEYTDANGTFISGTPFHIKAAISYNRLLDKHNLNATFKKIEDGDKIKVLHLKDPNIINNNGIAFIDLLPENLNIENYIDKETQFIKTFLDPIKRITDIMGWETEEKFTLEEFFS